MSNRFAPSVFVLALSIACVLLVLFGLHRALVRTGWAADKRQRLFWNAVISIGAWMALLALLSINGFFSNFNQMPPRVPLVVVLSVLISIILANSNPVKEILRVTPPHWLVALQSFRIVVEIFLWISFTRELIPVQMTWEGLNFDVVTGLLAIPAAILMKRYPQYAKRIGLTFNFIGIALLINILVIAILSMPVPFRYFTNSPDNSIVAQFPYVFLPGVLVVLAIFGHVFSIKQLVMKKSTELNTKQKAMASAH